MQAIESPLSMEETQLRLEKRLQQAMEARDSTEVRSVLWMEPFVVSPVRFASASAHLTCHILTISYCLGLGALDAQGA